jgi:hypothetical protein
MGKQNQNKKERIKTLFFYCLWKGGDSMTKTFAKRLNDAKNMLAGMATYANRISKRGISAEALTNANALYEQTTTLQNERNALKARSQEATVQAEELMEQLEGFCSEAKKLIKIEFPKETWPEFGFRLGEYAAQTAASPDDNKTATTEKSA